MNKDNILAGIFGAVVADALGVPYEFSSPEKMAENPATTMTGYGTYNKPVGTWSDDSSLTLALLDSLINGLDYEDIMYKFARWLYYDEYTPEGEVFDYGNTTYDAISRYYDEGKPALESGSTDIHSNGNGSIMRIIPIILYLNAKRTSVSEQIEIVDNISSLTHAHKISKASCNIYNFILQNVLDNRYKDLNELIIEGIDKSREYYENDEYECFNRIYNNLFSLSENEIESYGYVVDTLEVALYSCYHTDNYKDAVLKAVNFGGDTDTNAIVTGGLAAIYYGYDSIPEEWIDKLIKSDKIEDYCEKFYESLFNF